MFMKMYLHDLVRAINELLKYPLRKRLHLQEDVKTVVDTNNIHGLCSLVKNCFDPTSKYDA